MGMLNKLFGKKDQDSKSADASLAESEKEISAMAEQFVLISKREPDRNFDFSIESLQSVDDLLEEVRGFVNDMDDAAIQNLANGVGSYILEVARRNFGGSYYWYDETDQPILVSGLPEFAVSLLAIEKVKGRIVNGIEDNIPFFFDGYVSAMERGKNEKGYRAMIV